MQKVTDYLNAVAKGMGEGGGGGVYLEACSFKAPAGVQKALVKGESPPLAFYPQQISAPVAAQRLDCSPLKLPPISSPLHPYLPETSPFTPVNVAPYANPRVPLSMS